MPISIVHGEIPRPSDVYSINEGENPGCPDGLNSTQNAAVSIARTLKSSTNRQDVNAAMPILIAAITLNDPKLTFDEAKEVWTILYEFYVAYYGHLETQLYDLLQMLEDMFPEAVFK